jgi:hypothetical protein
MDKKLYTYSAADLRAAEALVKELDRLKRSGKIVPEFELTAQAICDARTRGTKSQMN